MPTEFLTPVGRIVWGHPLKPQKKVDQNTKQPVLRDGKEVEQWAFGLAIPKDQFAQSVWPYMQQEAATGYPNGVPGKFSWKYKDGDTDTDAKGNLYSTYEGRAGCYILTISTEAFAPPVYKQENGQYQQIEAHEIKTGDFVAVNLNLKVNVPTNHTHTPGLFVNPNGVILVGYGDEIVSSSFDPNEAFGGQQFQLPPGASATPTMGSAPLPSGMSGAPAPVAAPQPVQQSAPLPNAGVQSQQPASTAPANTMPPPATGFVQNAGVPPVQPAPVAAPGMPQGLPQGR